MHGFSEGKNKRIEVRLVVKDDEAVLRIHDNCGKFNPKKYYEPETEQYLHSRLIHGDGGLVSLGTGV